MQRPREHCTGELQANPKLVGSVNKPVAAGPRRGVAAPPTRRRRAIGAPSPEACVGPLRAGPVAGPGPCHQCHGANDVGKFSVQGDERAADVSVSV